MQHSVSANLQGQTAFILNCVFAVKTLTYLAAITVIGDHKLQDSKEKI